MKGFGGFTIAALLLSAAILAYTASCRESDGSFASAVSGEHAMGRLGTLRNAIVRSHGKLGGSDSGAWRLEVQGQLAQAYGMDVLIDGNRVTIIDNEHAAMSEFYLMP